MKQMNKYKWIRGIPPYELVVLHQKMYPHKDLGRVFGGRWVIMKESYKNKAKEHLITLTTSKNEIVIWNGLSFTQLLRDCLWAETHWYLPVRSDRSHIYI